jgi:hypothetical protein
MCFEPIGVPLDHLSKQCECLCVLLRLIAQFPRLKPGFLASSFVAISETEFEQGEPGFVIKAVQVASKYSSDWSDGIIIRKGLNAFQQSLSIGGPGSLETVVVKLLGVTAAAAADGERYEGDRQRNWAE